MPVFVFKIDITFDPPPAGLSSWRRVAVRYASGMTGAQAAALATQEHEQTDTLGQFCRVVKAVYVVNPAPSKDAPAEMRDLLWPTIDGDEGGKA